MDTSIHTHTCTDDTDQIVQCIYGGCTNKPIYESRTICRYHFFNPLICIFSIEGNKCRNRVKNITDVYCETHIALNSQPYSKLLHILKNSARLSDDSIKCGAVDIILIVAKNIFERPITKASSNYLINTLNIISFRIVNKQIGFGRKMQCQIPYDYSDFIKAIIVEFCKHNNIIVRDYTRDLTIIFNYINPAHNITIIN